MVPFSTALCPREDVHRFEPDLLSHGLSLSRTTEIVPAIEGIVSRLEAADFTPKEIFGVRLSLEEALVNAIKHGHQDDPSKQVQVRYQVTRECFLVEIEDQGPGFNPKEVPDPCAPENLERCCGRGLMLIKNYMTWVRFNGTGNRVTMCRLHGTT
jgi:serine/threonine-protein kinase RsbW